MVTSRRRVCRWCGSVIRGNWQARRGGLANEAQSLGRHSVCGAARVAWLLAAKAGDGVTALMLASQKGHQEVVQLLKNAGAKLGPPGAGVRAGGSSVEAHSIGRGSDGKVHSSGDSGGCAERCAQIGFAAGGAEKGMAEASFP
ncbi:MAG TPA: hypothetical protein VF515_10870 [Candidatus Binatia bacterium]